MIEFCIELRVATLELIKKVCSEESLSKSTVYEWYNPFEEDRDVTEDDPRSDRPQTTTGDTQMEAVRLILQKT